MISGSVLTMINLTWVDLVIALSQRNCHVFSHNAFLCNLNVENEDEVQESECFM